MQDLKLGIYQHFKGNKYYVIGIAKHSETLEELVVYIPLYDSDMSRIWVRPMANFLETVEKEGKVIPRFTYLGVK